MRTNKSFGDIECFYWWNGIGSDQNGSSWKNNTIISKGRTKCTLANWTGIAYKIPRIMLEQCKDRKNLKQSGVYFLFGASEKEDREKAVYVGQAIVRKAGEGLLNRLQEHRRNPKEDY